LPLAGDQCCPELVERIVVFSLTQETFAVLAHLVAGRLGGGKGSDTAEKGSNADKAKHIRQKVSG